MVYGTYSPNLKFNKWRGRLNERARFGDVLGLTWLNDTPISLTNSIVFFGVEISLRAHGSNLLSLYL